MGDNEAVSPTSTPLDPEPTKSTPRRRRGWLLWLGLTLILAGLIVLGYVLWQMFVTNWISHRQQREIVDSLERTWDDPEAATQEKVEVDGVRAGAILTIPRFGDDFAVPITDGISDEALAAGVGHFEESAKPGQKGNYALAGHRVTHGEPLRDMPELEAGDEIVVTTRTKVFTYTLDTAGDALTVPFTETWVIDPKPVNPDPDGVGPDPERNRLITLTTCSELFHTDGRLIAFGHLESVEQRS